MFERHIGDTKNSHGDEQSITEDMVTAQVKLKKGKNNIEHITVWTQNSTRSIIYIPSGWL